MAIFASMHVAQVAMSPPFCSSESTSSTHPAKAFGQASLTPAISSSAAARNAGLLSSSKIFSIRDCMCSPVMGPLATTVQR